MLDKSVPEPRRRILSEKTIDHRIFTAKKSAQNRRGFPVKNFAGPRAPKYYFLYLKMHFFKKVYFQIQKVIF